MCRVGKELSLGTLENYLCSLTGQNWCVKPHKPHKSCQKQELRTDLQKLNKRPLEGEYFKAICLVNFTAWGLDICRQPNACRKLMWRTYKLTAHNLNLQHFVRRWKHYQKKNGIKQMKIILAFLIILFFAFVVPGYN